jgi:hypothetical protein
MPIERRTSDETDEAVRTLGWLEICEIATWRGHDMIRIVGTLDGEHVDTYVEHDGASVIGSINSFDGTGGQLASVQRLEADMLAVDALEHAEILEFTMHSSSMRPTVHLVAAGAGELQIEMGLHDDMTAFIRRRVRERGQDGEGRTLSRLGAMTMAIGARGVPEIDRRIDTVFAGMKGWYGGVRYQTASDGKITTAIDHQGVQMRSDGIEIANLPETVRTGILGRQRRRLSQVVEAPGFEGLEVDGINQRAASSARLGGRWVRIDVRDEHGAKFEQVEREEARRIAHETYARRNP